MSIFLQLAMLVSCDQRSESSFPQYRYSRRPRRTRAAFRAAASRQLLAFEAAELILAFTNARDRLSAINAEVGLTLHARKEGIFAIKAERLVAPFTEERIFAIVTERLATPLTDEHLIAVVAKGIFTCVARSYQIVIALTAERLVARFADGKSFASVTE
jgi:hypothetical protein